MRKAWIGMVLAAVVGGCVPGTDELFLTQAEIEALQENFEGALEAQHLMAEFTFAAARGDLDLVNDYPGAQYTAPSDANGWTGTLVIDAAAFPFGTGDLTITFQTVADGVPVDPYAEDLTQATSVQVDADVNFDGISLSGAPLTGAADIALDTVQNGQQVVTAVLNGTLFVDHGGYDVALDPTDLELTFDVGLHEITNVTGALEGSVDIPDFVLDGNFDVDGLGDSIQIGIDVGATTIDYVIQLSEL